jgi:hypothetical protein
MQRIVVCYPHLGLLGEEEVLIKLQEELLINLQQELHIYLADPIQRIVELQQGLEVVELEQKHLV